MQGGIKAVVWTDFFQSFVMMLAFVAVIFVVSTFEDCVLCIVLMSYRMNCYLHSHCIFVCGAFGGWKATLQSGRSSASVHALSFSAYS